MYALYIQEFWLYLLVQRTTRVQDSRTKGAEPFKQTRYNLRKSSNKSTNFKHKAATHLLAQHIFAKQSAAHVFNDNGKKETINTLLFGHDLTLWTKSLSNELGRLA